MTKFSEVKVSTEKWSKVEIWRKGLDRHKFQKKWRLGVVPLGFVISICNFRSHFTVSSGQIWSNVCILFHVGWLRPGLLQGHSAVGNFVRADLPWIAVPLGFVFSLCPSQNFNGQKRQRLWMLWMISRRFAVLTRFAWSQEPNLCNFIGFAVLWLFVKALGCWEICETCFRCLKKPCRHTWVPHHFPRQRVLASLLLPKPALNKMFLHQWSLYKTFFYRPFACFFLALRPPFLWFSSDCCRLLWKDLVVAGIWCETWGFQPVLSLRSFNCPRACPRQ